MVIPGVWQMVPQGYRVFIPDPLPPQVDWGVAVLKQVEEATYLLGQLEMAHSLLPNPHLLVYASLHREAIASSTIEGTIAQPEELIAYEAFGRSEHEAVREVSNYIRALEWGIEQLPKLPICTRLILSLHERLLKGTRGSPYAGRYKQHQNFIAPSAYERDIQRALFVPPPPDRTPELMVQLEQYINGENTEPKLIQCALVHYQFETIHPFADGNGRVGRLLIILHLIQLGLLSGPYLHPSVYFERTREQYYSLLQGVRERGDWEPWVRYFVAGIIHQTRGALQLVQTLQQLLHQLREQVQSIRRRASVQAVLECFFEKPLLSSSEVARKSGLSYTTALSALDELARMGIVQEMTGRQKRLQYLCLPLMRAIFEQETPL